MEQQSPILQQSITSLKGVGNALAEKLARLHIFQVQDLLFHLPLRYEDRTRVTPIGSLVAGQSAMVEAEVLHTEVTYRRRRTMLCQISDGTGSLTLRFFYFSKAQAEGLAKGKKIRCFSEVRRGPKLLEMVHPEYKVVANDIVMEMEESLTPIYPATDGVQQPTLRKLMRQVIPLIDDIPEYLPSWLLNKASLPSLPSALITIHQPSPGDSLSALQEGLHPSCYRLIFEELLAHQLGMQIARMNVAKLPGVKLSADSSLATAFMNNLPFQLTNAQQRVYEDVKTDIQHPHPMTRLVQGDVGSGKTVVAALSCLHAAEHGYQAALMAPTEILAEQHFQNFKTWCADLGITCGFLSSGLKAKAKREAIEKISNGDYQLVIGTHALFQEQITFKNLALVVIDEQHRFGVHQRLALRQKGEFGEWVPHQLIMTATPIPRTLAMTHYADLDSSVIDELPPGRQAITTTVINNSKRSDIIARIAEVCASGQQAYWVCTLIETSEVLQCQAAEEAYQILCEHLPQTHVGLIHGRLKSAEKEAIMQSFSKGDIQLLVATTVIEVGVDVPNASLMIIENPERLGLSQLHQLRGRVGRGQKASYCVLMYQHPLSKNGKRRLEAMRSTQDGFKIAEIDLELRGPGELLGTKQTGDLDFRIADIQRDKELIPPLANYARELIEQKDPAVPSIIQRWTGDKSKYKNV